MNSGSMNGKVVVVTGAGRGLGKAMAQALGDEGATVVITGRDEARLQSAAQEFTARGITCSTRVMDVLDAGHVESTADSVVSEFGRVDVLFANAGVTIVKPSLEMSSDEFDQVLRANVTGVFNCCKAWGRHMLAEGHGKIINVGSNMGITGMAGWVAYAASKAAVTNMTKSLAWEWAPSITVNCLAPGAHRTEMNEVILAIPEVEAGLIAATPLGRIGLPHELGAVALFLAGSGSDYMTGETLCVDGGIRRS